jgi:hypothetical protein
MHARSTATASDFEWRMATTCAFGEDAQFSWGEAVTNRSSNGAARLAPHSAMDMKALRVRLSLVPLKMNAFRIGSEQESIRILRRVGTIDIVIIYEIIAFSASVSS